MNWWNFFAIITFGILIGAGVAFLMSMAFGSFTGVVMSFIVGLLSIATIYGMEGDAK